MIKPNRIKANDNVAIIAPCYAMEESEKAIVEQSLVKLSLNPVYGKNLLKKTIGFAATPEERAEDFNNAIYDDTIKMILFEGGEVSNEILPLIDYEAVAKHPKIICSYSDSTSVLNAVSVNSNIVTYYGQSWRATIYSDYNTRWFKDCFMSGETPKYISTKGLNTVYGGKADGTFIGGYLLNFALLVDSRYFTYDKSKDYILFLEDNLCFNGVPAVSRYLSHIAQSQFFSNVKGLLIGHYSVDPAPDFDKLISDFAHKYKLPCMQCHDFGHNDDQAILPIGINGTLDCDFKKITFSESFSL